MLLMNALYSFSIKPHTKFQNHAKANPADLRDK